MEKLFKKESLPETPIDDIIDKINEIIERLNELE